jgi:negative regulator of flagellin synthesis FlgM
MSEPRGRHYHAAKDMTDPLDHRSKRNEGFTMKISHDVAHPMHSPDKPTAKPAIAPGRIVPTRPTLESVKISDVSRSLATATSAAEPPFDTQRVEAIKAAISAGQFKVDPEAVADKVIDSASQLLGKTA